MEHQLEATEQEALESLRKALQLGALPVDPPGWFTVSQMARKWECGETTVRHMLRDKAAEVETMMAIRTVNGTRVRTHVYRLRGQP